MKEIGSNEMATQFLEQLPRGAFLTVKSGDSINTMTIGWGSIGYVWKKPVLMVMVRYSRYTHQLLQNAQDFTVSLPMDSNMKSSLATAGTKSGRDIDKFATCKLTVLAGQAVDSPVIGECGLFYECKIVYKQTMDPEGMEPAMKDVFYGDNDLHVLYYGEIVSCYTKD